MRNAECRPSQPLGVTIGEASKVTGISAKMIRYYESIGLVPPPHRLASGYRSYRPEQLHTLRFIRRSRDLGFSLGAIAELLTLWQDRGRASADVKAVALGHVATLKAKIEELQAMVDTLEHLAQHCYGDERPDCPILGDLAEEPYLPGNFP